MLNSLPPRERQIVDILYTRQGGCTVSDVCEALPDALSASAVRAMLSRLEGKGFVTRSQGPRGILYAPAVPEAKAKESVLGQVVRVFFNGSPVSAASALLGMSDRLGAQELDELEALIARARAEQKGKDA